MSIDRMDYGGEFSAPEEWLGKDDPKRIAWEKKRAEKFEKQKEAEQIYIVRTYGDCEGKSLQILGYAKGEKNEIYDYFFDQRVYDKLDIDPIKIIDVSPEAVKERIQAIERKKQLEAELAEIDKHLKR